VANILKNTILMKLWRKKENKRKKLFFLKRNLNYCRGCVRGCSGNPFYKNTSKVLKTF